MNDILKKYIERVYIKKDYKYYRECCEKNLEYLDELIDEIKPMCQDIKATGNDECRPGVIVTCDVEKYEDGDFRVRYFTKIIISKVTPFFIIKHMFFADNADPDGLRPVLQGRFSPYIFAQYNIEETTQKHLNEHGVLNLEFREENEKIIGVDWPETCRYGRQISVGEAITQDIACLLSHE